MPQRLRRGPITWPANAKPAASRRYLLAGLLLLLSSGAWAQGLSGTKTIPGSYPSLAAAIADLNTNGVGTGGVTFNIAAGYTETFTSTVDGRIALNSSSTNPATASNPIVFQKAGSGANPVFTGVGTAGTTDAVLSVVGTDYVTFTGLDVAVSGTAVEYGYALFRASATDGSQRVTVSGATITLNKSNTGAIGIYGATTNAAGTAITTSSAAGANSNNTFTGNTISNVASGIRLNGYNNASYYDTGNSVGGAAPTSGTTPASTGNTVTGFGVAGVATYGVYVSYQSGALLNNNTVSGAGTTAAIYGIYQDVSTGTSVAMSYNTATLTQSGNFPSMGVYNAAAGVAGSTMTLSNNTVSLTLTAASPTAATTYGVYNAATATTTTSAITLTGNYVILSQSGFTGATTTAVLAGVYNAVAAGSLTLSANTVKGTITNTTGNSGNGNMYGVWNTGAANSATGALALNGNAVTLTLSTSAGGGFGAGGFFGVYNTGAAANTASLSSNSFAYSTTLGGSAGFGSPVYGVYNAATVANTLTMDQNAPVTLSVAVTVTSNGYNSSGSYGVYNAAAVTNGISLSQNQVGITTSSGTIGQSAQNQGYNPSDFGVYNTGTVSAATGTISLNGNTVSFAPTLNGSGNNNAGQPSYGVGNTGTLSSTATTSTPALSLTGNTITLAATFNSTGNVGPASGTGSNLFGVFNSGGVSSATGTLAMTTNTVSVTATSNTSGSTGTIARPILGVFNSGTISGTGAAAASLTGNTVSGSSTVSGSGTTAPVPTSSLTGVSNTSTVSGGASLSGNSLFTSATAYPTTGGVTLLNNTGAVAGPLTISNNQVGPASGAATFRWNSTSYLITSTAGSGVLTVSGNSLRNVTSTGTGAGTALNVTAGATGSTISGNTIGAFTGGGAVTGIAVSPTSITVSGNKIYGLSGTAAGSVVTGVAVTGGTATVQNNLVGNLTAPASTSGTAVAGITVSGGTAANLYYNTVYLSGGGGTGFGSSAVYLSSTTPTVTLLNNIFDNQATASGTGRTVALRRTTTATTGYASTSDYNLYYAGAPSASNLLYYDGTNSYQLLADFKAGTGIAPRETHSQTEDVPFANNSTGSGSDYLHLSPSAATIAESGGVVLPSPTTDYDGQARGPYTNSLAPFAVAGTPQANGGGTAPDLGADEGDFVPQPPITVQSLVYNRLATNNVQVGTPQAAVGLTVAGSATGSPTIKLNSLNVNLLLGSTTPASDATNPQLYASPTSTFDPATAVLLPSTNNFVSGTSTSYTLTLTNGSTLSSGNNYFFLTYTIAANASDGDQVSSDITQVTIGGVAYTSGSTPPLASSGSLGYLTIVGALKGVYYIDPNSSTATVASGRSFVSFTDAVNTLNARGVAAAVSFEVAPGQTYLEGGTLVPVITVTGTATTPITFERDPGTTANFSPSSPDPVLQPTGGAGSNDAALALAGGDYFTFSHLTIGQPGGSSALEYGIALFRASAVNGAQNNTVQFCTITLDKTNAASTEIYGATTTSATPAVAVATSSPAGANSNNTFTANTLSGGANGIVLNGYNNASYYDTGNSVGGAAPASGTTPAATGNTVSSFGSSATSYGVFASYQAQAQLNNNTVTGASSGNAALYGVYQGPGTATDVAMSYNTVTLTLPISAATGSSAYGVYNAAAGTATNSATLSFNTVTITATANSSGNYTGTVAGVYNSAASGTITLSSNPVSLTAANTGAGSFNGILYGVYNTGNAQASTGALTLDGNPVALTFSTAAGGGFGASGQYGVYNTGTAANTASLSANSYTYKVTLGGTAGYGPGAYGIFNAGVVSNTLTMSRNSPVNSVINVAGTSNYNGSVVYGVYNSANVANGIAMSQNQATVTPTNAAAPGQGYNAPDYGVYNVGSVSAATGTISLNNNTVTYNPTLSGAGSFSPGSLPSYGVGNTGSLTATSGPTALSLTGNSATFAPTLSSTGSVGGTTAIYEVFNSGSLSSPGGALTMSTNSVALNVATASSGVVNRPLYGVYNSGAVAGTSATAATLDGNTVTGSNSGAGSASTNALYGVYNSGTITGGASMSGNQLFTTAGSSHLTTGSLYFLYNSGVVNNANAVGSLLTISGNAVGPASGTASFAPGSSSYLAYNVSTTAGPTTFANNTFQNLTSTGGGSLYAYYNNASPAGDFTASGNSYANLTTGGVSLFYGLNLSTSNTAQKQTIINNSFTNISVGNSTVESTAIFVNAGAATSQVAGNTVAGFSSTGTGALTGIRLGGSLQGGNVLQNTLGGLSNSGSGAVTGIASTAVSPVIYRNKVYGLSGTAAASTVAGIAVAGGTTVTVHTNLIGNLTAPASTSAPAVAGLSVAGGNNVSVLYNSVYLAGNNSSTTAASYGFYRSGTSSAVTLRNNILYNERTDGVANYAIGTASTTGWVGSMSNPGTNSSDYNLLLTADAGQVGNFGGTTYSFAGWKTATGGDGSSLSETTATVPAASLFTNASTGDLSLNAANSAAWYANGTGMQVASISTDYSGTTPRPTTVAAGAPDLGATEVTPTSIPPAMTATPATPALGTTQTFALGGRTLAQLAWGSNLTGRVQATLPSLVVGRYYSGTTPPAPFAAGAKYANVYFDFSDANGDGSGYTYQPTLTYDPALLGTINSEADQRISQRNADNSGYRTYATTVNPAPTRTLVGPDQFNFLSVLAISDQAAPLPVQLVKFEAQRQGADALLTWTTASELNNRGFEVQASLDGSSYRPLGFVAGAGSSSTAHSYRFLDQEAGKAGLRYYRLRQLDLNGPATYSPVRTLTFEVTGLLVQAAPNPFAGSLMLHLTLPAASTAPAELHLTDALGRTVLRQALGTLPAGTTQAELTGASQLPAGVYLLHVSVSGESRTLKVVRE